MAFGISTIFRRGFTPGKTWASDSPGGKISTIMSQNSFIRGGQNMKEKTLADALISGVNECRRLTYDFVDCLSVEKLNQRLPRPGLNTIAKHVLEIAAVQT